MMLICCGEANEKRVYVAEQQQTVEMWTDLLLNKS